MVPVSKSVRESRVGVRGIVGRRGEEKGRYSVVWRNLNRVVRAQDRSNPTLCPDAGDPEHRKSRALACVQRLMIIGDRAQGVRRSAGGQSCM